MIYRPSALKNPHNDRRVLLGVGAVVAYDEDHRIALRHIKTVVDDLRSTDHSGYRLLGAAFGATGSVPRFKPFRGFGYQFVAHTTKTSSEAP